MKTGVVGGIAVAALVVACAQATRPSPTPSWVPRMEKMQEINALWIEIRGMRRELKLDSEPPRPLELQYAGKTVQQIRAACPDEQRTQPTCTDTCNLANAICDNAETICKIADELGKADPAQDKCTSAKASCREAKQRCCDCNANPPEAEVAAPPAAPAPVPAGKAPTP